MTWRLHVAGARGWGNLRSGVRTAAEIANAATDALGRQEEERLQKEHETLKGRAGWAVAGHGVRTGVRVAQEAKAALERKNVALERAKQERRRREIERLRKEEEAARPNPRITPAPP